MPPFCRGGANPVLCPLASGEGRIHWTLQLGYFKAKQQFFTFVFPEMAEDARYIQQLFLPDLQFSELERAAGHLLLGLPGETIVLIPEYGR